MYKTATFVFKNNGHKLETLARGLRRFSGQVAVKEQKVLIKGQTVNYIKVGNGGHTILCFPGALGTIWSDFKPQIENLDRSKFTIVAWDPPGYGHSRPPNKTFNMDFYHNDADMAHSFMKELGFNKFSLLGWSDGGNSSMILSARYPDSVDKLVVWGSNAYIIKEEIDSYEKIKDIQQWSEKMRAPLVALYGETGLQDMWSGWCNTMLDIFKLNGGNVCKEDLPLIKSPTLIVHGDKDPLVSAEQPIYLSQKIKHSKTHHFPDGKHNLHLKYAKEFNSLVTNFLLA